MRDHAEASYRARDPDNEQRKIISEIRDKVVTDRSNRKEAVRIRNQSLFKTLEMSLEM